MKTTIASFALVALTIALYAHRIQAGALGGGQQAPLGISTTSEGATRVQALALESRGGELATKGVPAIWYAAGRRVLRARTDTGVGSIAIRLDPGLADSATLANPVTLTPFSSKERLPARTLSQGRVLTVTAWGRLAAPAVPFGDERLTLGVRIGNITITSEDVAVPATAAAWCVTVQALVRTAGEGGTLVALARAEAGRASSVGRFSGSIDTTVAHDVAPVAAFTASDPANAITCEGLLVE